MKKAFVVLALLVPLLTYSLTLEEMQFKLDEIQAQVNVLRAQISALLSGKSTASTTPSAKFAFTKDLRVGSTGVEVTELQKMLESSGNLTMPQGVAYGYYGEMTKNAVIKWQKANGVSPASGLWGTASRAKYASSGSISSSNVISTKGKAYPLHTGITAAVFWVGEPVGNGSSEDNALSAWDDEWQKHYGGYDDYENRDGYYPKGFTPKENPFYLDLPYNDFNDNGSPKANRKTVVPWANEKNWTNNESMMKNRWVKLTRNGVTCYGQIQDAGPYQYDDYNYVFSTTDARPKNKTANNAGMDVSPALRDCLKFNGVNNVSNKVDWQFVDSIDVPPGPWKEIITTSQIYWP